MGNREAGGMRSDRSAGASWRQTTLYGLVEARQIGTAAAGSGAAAHRVRLADGTTSTLDGDVVCERLSSEHGQRLVLTVERAAHVLSRHMRGKLTGAFLPGMTLTRLLALFCRHWHEPVGFAGEVHKISVSCHRVIGSSATASAKELAELGVLSPSDLRRLAHLKDEVLAVNMHGSRSDRAGLVARANRQWRGRNVRLTERNGIVLPAFIAPPLPARSFVVVFDRSRGAGAGHGRERQILTMQPGRLLCESPSHARYTALRERTECSETAIGQLQRDHETGGALTQRERELLSSYRHALEVWYENGALLPPALRERRPALPA